jgi:hypothetical protein
VDESITVGEPFNIRELSKIKKQATEYVAIILTGCHAKIYTGDNILLKRMATLSADYVPEAHEPAEDTAAGCHMSKTLKSRDEIITKFIEHVDNTLHYFFEAHPLPVFVFGTVPTVEYFKKITRYRAHVTDFFAGTYQDLTEAGIIELLQPYFKSWEKIKETNLLLFFEKAFAEKHAYAGIKEVYNKSLQKRPWLLVVEKNYTSNVLTLPEDSIYAGKNDVEAVIENILAQGGEVEFVTGGSLAGYSHIGLLPK